MKTVSQFIEELKQLPQDAPISYWDNYVEEYRWPHVDEHIMKDWQAPEGYPKGVVGVAIIGEQK